MYDNPGGLGTNAQNPLTSKVLMDSVKVSVALKIVFNVKSTSLLSKR